MCQPSPNTSILLKSTPLRVMLSTVTKRYEKCVLGDDVFAVAKQYFFSFWQLLTTDEAEDNKPWVFLRSPWSKVQNVTYLGYIL